MPKHLTVTPAEGESLDEFAERMAKKVADHFGTPTEEPVPTADGPEKADTETEEEADTSVPE